ncbi:MAG: hypothetical protein ACR2OZ_09900 [Verrucomicrobiales bacterium]
MRTEVDFHTILSAAIVCWTVAVGGRADGQVIFKADFDSQPAGPLATGSPPGLPQVIIADAGASVNVVAAAGDLTERPVLLHSMVGSLAVAAFFNPSQLSSGDWRVSWDSLILGTPINDPPEQNNVAISASSGGSFPTIWGIKYLPTGQFSVEDDTGFHSVGTFDVGGSDHFDLNLRLDSRTYELSVNGGSLLSGGLKANGEFGHTGFSSNGRPGLQLPDFAFDNFMVQQIPEPSALALGAAAFILWVFVRSCG